MIKDKLYTDDKRIENDRLGFSTFLFRKENAIINSVYCFIGTKRGNRSYRLVDVRYMKIDFVCMYNKNEKRQSW